ncbi:unnamed protein product [Rhizoctonia solani]|uniref:Uncharacterized protein n=1 Tax=Rhizoctonia solani TaxID=456999 RepID=A0A8H2XEM5_9AGAM|nr:unnamed protein product [Rhizoctonia solani]
MALIGTAIHAMPAQLQVPLIPFLTPQSLLFSGVPHAWPLDMFCAHILQIPELAEAHVRVVWCHRERVHEFILVNCDVTTPAHNTVSLWLRIERRPDGQGVGVLLNKPKPAMDTVKASTSIEALRGQSESRDSFMYNPHEKSREVLKLKNIVEMCQYFAGHSGEYSLLGANCRWICYVLLECLRESRPCYGGAWLPSGTERPTADVRAAQLAKSHYLKDKHSACCGRQYLSYPNLGPQIARATMSWTSIAITTSSQSTDNRGSQCVEQDTLYRTPRSLPESVVPLQPSTLATNGGGNLATEMNAGAALQSPAPPSNVAPSNTTELPPRPSTAQPDRRNDVSPVPTGANATQRPQSSPSTDNINSSQHQQRTTPPVEHATLQPGGDASIPPHCLGCQCASHSHSRNIPGNSQNGHTLQSSLAESRSSNTSDLSSRFSSMNIGSDMSIPGVIHRQSVGENVSILRVPNSTTALNTHQCSGCGSQGSFPAQLLASHGMPAPVTANPANNSFSSTCSVPSGRIHTNFSRHTVQPPTNIIPTQRNSMTSMNTQCSGYHGQRSSRVDVRNDSPSSTISHTTRIPTGVNHFDAPNQRFPQLSYPTSIPSAADVATGCAAHQHRTSSTASGCPSCSSQDLTNTQGCHHTHNHPPGGLPGPSRPMSHNYPSSHGGALPHSTRRLPPTPTHQGVQGNHQAYIHSNSLNSTRDSYLASGNYSCGSNSPIPRKSVNRSTIYHSRSPHDHTRLSSLPLECNADMTGDHYQIASPTVNLYSIPEGASQAALNDQWAFMNGPMDTSLPTGYDAQSVLPNHGQPPHVSNPPVHANIGYPNAQHSGAIFQEPYISNEAPTSSYSQLEQPARRQWTQELWADQGFGLPTRTDSPAPMEYNQTEGAYALAPGPPVVMLDHRDYTQYWGVDDSVLEQLPPTP